jgi:hypothetical protein
MFGMSNREGERKRVGRRHTVKGIGREKENRDKDSERGDGRKRQGSRESERNTRKRRREMLAREKE